MHKRIRTQWTYWSFCRIYENVVEIPGKDLFFDGANDDYDAEGSLCSFWFMSDFVLCLNKLYM